MNEAIQTETPELPLGVYRARFRADAAQHLPKWTGSAWRGVFGRALRCAVCVTRARSCEGCLLLRNCPYPYLFETPLLAGSGAPTPYVLVPGEARRGHGEGPGETVALGLVLIGERALGMLPYVIHALERAGERGLTTRRVHLALEGVQAWDSGAGAWRPIYTPGAPLAGASPLHVAPPPVPRRLTVHLLSPLRMRTHGCLLRPEAMDFAQFFRAVARRIQALARVHGGAVDSAVYPRLVRLAAEVPLVDPQLEWRDWVRYSSRQRTRMRIGGVIGRFLVEGANLAPFMRSPQGLYMQMLMIIICDIFRLALVGRAPWARWSCLRRVTFIAEGVSMASPKSDGGCDGCCARCPKRLRAGTAVREISIRVSSEERAAGARRRPCKAGTS